MLYWNCNVRTNGTRAGKGRRVVHPRGRMLPRCRVVHGWIPTVGCQGTALSVYSLRDVCACCWIQAEGSGKVDLPQLLAWTPQAGPQGRCTSCPASGIPDLQRRNQAALPSGVHVKEVAQTPTVWAQMSTGSNPGHFVFFEGLPMVEQRWLFTRKWRTGAHWHLSVPPLW